MVGGEVDLGSYADEEISSSFFEDVPSRVDVVVFIRLRLVGEAPAYAFWKIYSFPPNVWVSFPSLSSHFTTYTEEDRGGMNSMYMYWLEVHISEGLRFPLPPLVHQFFYFTHLHPIHTHVSIIRVLLMGMRIESSIQCALRFGGGPLCVYHKVT